MTSFGFLLGFCSKYFLTQYNKRKRPPGKSGSASPMETIAGTKVIKTSKNDKSPSPPLRAGKDRNPVLVEVFASALTTLLRRERHHAPKCGTIWTEKTSLVNGFDRSTEEMGFSVRFGDKNRVAPFVVKNENAMGLGSVFG
jgi:hypothetical protein